MGVLFPTSEPWLDDLIATAQADPADDSVAMNEILRRFERLAQKICRSVSADPHVQQDVAQEARLGLVKAVRAHHGGTSGFPSYARRFMSGAALRFVTSLAMPEATCDPQDEFWTDPDVEAMQSSTAIEVIDLFRVLTPEQRRIAVARYVANEMVSDIANSLGISVSAVSQRLNTIHRALRPVVEAAVVA
jgi:RNA polymerase sigma factor (sigma-70 family)